MIDGDGCDIRGLKPLFNPDFPEVLKAGKAKNGIGAAGEFLKKLQEGMRIRGRL